MGQEQSAAKRTRSPRHSRLRLRLGVALILLWWIPFWALAPRIAHSLSGLSNPPSTAAVTTAIVVVQTILGLLGFWIAGTEVKAIIKGSTRKQALSTIWAVLIHGEVRGREKTATDSGAGDPPRVDA